MIKDVELSAVPGTLREPRRVLDPETPLTPEKRP